MAHVTRATLNTAKLEYRSRLGMAEGSDMYFQKRSCNANSAQHEEETQT